MQLAYKTFLAKEFYNFNLQLKKNSLVYRYQICDIQLLNWCGRLWVMRFVCYNKESAKRQLDYMTRYCKTLKLIIFYLVSPALI